ncbi:hypothetical protein HII36_49470 [Nonomuraea sp. NN258]|uniref:hypothetical protein n=1 Tax=Nonomuraea antri TaxID=2730852 RepID=UPI0015680556|nr:hypothetical protein [Nonomuraea antri]NRQ39808.1 hypothetical protein [Nonomuraea antri]
MGTAHPTRPRLRTIDTSCCGEYELACEGGEYLVLRWTGEGEKQQEAARGVFPHAKAVFNELSLGHHCFDQRGSWTSTDAMRQHVPRPCRAPA